MPVTEALLRELNHRVKNNFQIIASLVKLKQRMLPQERRDDLRFIEEHVQSMSVAYRLVYAHSSMIEFSLAELIAEVLAGLGEIATLPEEQLRIEIAINDEPIGLDQGIALALYLAVVAPPYLDMALASNGLVLVEASVADDFLTLSIGGTWPGAMPTDFLRTRLMEAYTQRLSAEIVPTQAEPGQTLLMKIEPPTTIIPAAR